MSDTSISIHHVGARNGMQPFPLLGLFKNDIECVMYDADPECVEHAKEVNILTGIKTTILPLCIAGEASEANFYLNSDPYTSSLLKKDPAYDEFCMYHGKTDCVVKDVMKNKQTLRLTCKSLDNLYFEEKIEGSSAPDFLSLDTQGTELFILEGAKRCLENIVAVETEIEFVPYYEGQGKYYKLLEFMDKNGFILVDFTHLERGALKQCPVGFRGDGQLSHGDVIFLKDPKHLIAGGKESEGLLTKLKKLVFISMIYEQFEIASVGLDYIKTKEGVDFSTNTVYEKFVKELIAQSEKLKTYPPRFTADFETSKKQFTPQNERLEKFMFLRKIYRYSHSKFFSVKSFTLKLVNMQNNEFERFLLSYGMKSQAKSIKRNRIKYY